MLEIDCGVAALCARKLQVFGWPREFHYCAQIVPSKRREDAACWMRPGFANLFCVYRLRTGLLILGSTEVRISVLTM